MQTFEEYLKNETQGIGIDFRLAVIKDKDENITFYIHPLNRDGETPYFKVEGNTLTNVTDNPNRVS